MAITAIYASVLALIFVALSVRVIGARRAARVALGDGGDAQLLRRQRVHANFAEYVPLALILMLLAEQQGAAAWIVHGIGVLLLAGRLFHAVGVSQSRERIWQRVTGMSLTFGAIVTGAIVNLVRALMGPGII